MLLLHYTLNHYRLKPIVVECGHQVLPHELQVFSFLKRPFNPENGIELGGIAGNVIFVCVLSPENTRWLQRVVRQTIPYSLFTGVNTTIKTYVILSHSMLLSALT